MDWFELLNKAKANGLEYATNGIAGGERSPQHSPLSGEWAGAISPKDVVDMAAGREGAFNEVDECELTDICDAWEDGYFSAPWPAHPADEN